MIQTRPLFLAKNKKIKKKNSHKNTMKCIHCRFTLQKRWEENDRNYCAALSGGLCCAFHTYTFPQLSTDRSYTAGLHFILILQIRKLRWVSWAMTLRRAEEARVKPENSFAQSTHLRFPDTSLCPCTFTAPVPKHTSILYLPRSHFQFFLNPSASVQNISSKLLQMARDSLTAKSKGHFLAGPLRCETLLPWLNRPFL